MTIIIDFKLNNFWTSFCAYRFWQSFLGIVQTQFLHFSKAICIRLAAGSVTSILIFIPRNSFRASERRWLKTIFSSEI